MAGRILIVDNIPTNRIILKVKLSSAFYEVIQTTSGAEAIARANDSHPEIIILDAELGDMSAHAVCAELKNSPTTRHIPVIISTPSNDSEAKIAALKAGADEFLSKPVDGLALTARVRALMRARATTDELRRRDETAQSLGFAEPQTGFETPGKIALVGRTIEDAMTWRAGLRGLVSDQIDIVSSEHLIEKISEGDAADVYVISCDMQNAADGLHMISDIRARQHTRSAGLIMVHKNQDNADAIMALDLGANDIIARGADPEEMALRLRSQMRRKKEKDALRMTVDEGLRLAMVDPLTGLYNRRYALPHLAKIAEQSTCSGQSFAIMLLDLDHFKLINDTHGHAAGDQTLIEVAKRLQGNLRSEDLAARIGGEEFLISMPMTSLKEARHAAERLREIICATPVALAQNGAPVFVSTSIGLAMGGAQVLTDRFTTEANAVCSGASIEALLHIADRALYDAKTEGRNQVTLGSCAA